MTDYYSYDKVPWKDISKNYQKYTDPPTTIPNNLVKFE